MEHLHDLFSGMTREEKNQAGERQKYGCCPNCKDSWLWKECGSLPYDETGGVLICTECLAMPEGLDKEKIAEHLLRYGWPTEKVALVKQRVDAYKNVLPSQG